MPKMASEITDEISSTIKVKEAEKKRIRQLIAYQKSIYFSSSSLSSSSSSFSSATYSSVVSPRKSSSLMDLMKEGSTCLGRLFDMEHTSLGNYFKDYSVSPIIKPILLWGSDDIIHDDPWAEIGSAFGSTKDEEFVQHRKRGNTRKRILIRTKSYKRLPRFGFWRCGVFRKIRVMIRGRKF